MIRITETTPSKGVVSLLIEGHLVGTALDILREECERKRVGCVLRLDLAGIAFADRTAVAFLRNQAAKNVILENCPSFLTEALREAE